jgi:hypothetical protein
MSSAQTTAFVGASLKHPESLKGLRPQLFVTAWAEQLRAFAAVHDISGLISMGAVTQI